MLGALEEDDDMEFADARENFLPANADEIDAASGARQGDGENDGFAANLVAQSRRVRPEYVQYARVAKKVDVRRLKEEMWRGCGFDKVCTISIHLASLLSYRLLVAFSIGMQACPEERERI
jgi:condensin complex subunit 2